MTHNPTTPVPPTSPAPHLATGARGEELAATYLTNQGLIILSRNWRCREGELDLVATDRIRLIVCEVKTRTSTNFGYPADAVTAEKANRIRLLARRWRAAHGITRCRERFDIISVIWPPDAQPTLQHFRGAF